MVPAVGRGMFMWSTSCFRYFCDFAAKFGVKQQNSTDFLPDELLIALGEPPPPLVTKRRGFPTRLPNLHRSTVCSCYRVKFTVSMLLQRSWTVRRAAPYKFSLYCIVLYCV